MSPQRLRHYATTFDGDKLEFTATIPDDCSADDVEIMLSHQRLDLRIRNESLLTLPLSCSIKRSSAEVSFHERTHKLKVVADLLPEGEEPSSSVDGSAPRESGPKSPPSSAAAGGQSEAQHSRRAPANAAERHDEQGGVQEEPPLSFGATDDIARRQPQRRKGPTAGSAFGPWTPNISSSSSAQVLHAGSSTQGDTVSAAGPEQDSSKAPTGHTAAPIAQRAGGSGRLQAGSVWGAQRPPYETRGSLPSLKDPVEAGPRHPPAGQGSRLAGSMGSSRAQAGSSGAVRSPASEDRDSAPLLEDPAEAHPRQLPVRLASQAATATASMAGEGAAAGAGSGCSQAGNAWSAQRSAPESGNSHPQPGVRDPEDLKPWQLPARPGNSPAALGSAPLAGQGPAAPAAAAVDSHAGSVLAGGAQVAQTGCTWGARCPASESGIFMPGLEDPKEVEQAAARSSTGWVGLHQAASSSSMADWAGNSSPSGQAGSSLHAGQAGSSTGPGWAGCQPNFSQAGTTSASDLGGSSSASGRVGGTQGARADEEELCGMHTAAHAQHAGLSIAPDAAAALEELLQMVGGQAPTDDLRQQLAKVQAANVTAARASVRTPAGAAAAGCHHPDVLQRAAANRDAAWDCLARAKRIGLGQQMLPQDLMVSVIRLLVKCTQLDPVVVGLHACGSLTSLRNHLKGVGEETASSASPTAGQRAVAEDDHKEGAAWEHGIEAEAPSSWQVTWEHVRSGCRSYGDRAVKVALAALRCPGTATVQFLFGNRAFRHKGEASCLHCQLAPICFAISAMTWALLADLMVQAFRCGGRLPACQAPASCSLPGRMARALLSRQCRTSSPALLRWLWRSPAWLSGWPPCGLLGWLWRQLVWRPPLWVMAVHAAGLGHHWDFLGWVLSVWTSQGGWRALAMPLWLISAWKHHVLHQQPIKLCGGCILGSIVWMAMYQAGIFNWMRQLKYLIPLAVIYFGFCIYFRGPSQSSGGQRGSPAPAGKGPLSRVPVRGSSGEIKRILDCTCHYAVLGVPPEADKPAIAAARKAKSLMVHPDRQGGGSTAGSHEAQQRVNQAADVLGRPADRRNYDQDRQTCMLPPSPPLSKQSTGPAWLREPHMRRALEGFHIPVGCNHCGQGHTLRACVDHGAERPCSTCGSHKVDRGDMWVEMSGLFGWQRKMMTCLSVADLFDSDTELGAGLESLYGPLTNLLLVCDMTEAATLHRYFDHGLPVNTCDAVTNILAPTRANSNRNNNAHAWPPHGPRSKRKIARKARNRR